MLTEKQAKALRVLADAGGPVMPRQFARLMWLTADVDLFRQRSDGQPFIKCDEEPEKSALRHS